MHGSDGAYGLGIRAKVWGGPLSDEGRQQEEGTALVRLQSSFKADAVVLKM